MKKLIIPLLATAALALPAAAAAHDGWHHRWGHDHLHAFADIHPHKVLLAQLAGTGTDFAAATATASGTSTSDMLGAGKFAATITTNWPAAHTWTGDRGTLSCAPATASLTLVGPTATTSTIANLTGKTCTWTPAGSTTTGGAMFIGRDASVTGSGTVANLTGTVEKAFLWERDGTVKGAVFAGMAQPEPTLAVFQTREHVFAARTGHCDGDGH